MIFPSAGTGQSPQGITTFSCPDGAPESHFWDRVGVAKALLPAKPTWTGDRRTKDWKSLVHTDNHRQCASQKRKDAGDQSPPTTSASC